MARATGCSGRDSRSMAPARRQPRRDRLARLPHLPRARHRDRRRALRRRRSTCRTSPRPTSPSASPARRRPTPTCVPTSWSSAALRAGADAVHPGYGFLSENAAFARAVTDAGLVWVGPAPESIEQMGSKVEAKRIMAAAGVPVLSAPPEPSDADLPLIVKASAGGGGRGMRIVRDARRPGRRPSRRPRPRRCRRSATGPSSSSRTSSTAATSRCRSSGSADGVVVLGERDCSLQRRHQKVVEETPAPHLPEATRAALHDAARSAASAIDYVGAGTVEFLYDAGGRPVLLPGDEHPSPGRAPGDRAGPRRRPGGASARGG